MDKSYWDLFWITGMPEAWLMSRDQALPCPLAREGGPGLDPSLPDPAAPPPSGAPGGPRNLY